MFCVVTDQWLHTGITGIWFTHKLNNNSGSHHHITGYRYVNLFSRVVLGTWAQEQIVSKNKIAEKIGKKV